MTQAGDEKRRGHRTRADPVLQSDVDDLRARLSRTRWPGREPVPDRSQGAPLAAVRDLCEHWRTAYDWRRCEAVLNGWNPHRTSTDGVDVHVFHFAAFEQPGSFVDEVRAGLRALP